MLKRHKDFTKLLPIVLIIVLLVIHASFKLVDARICTTTSIRSNVKQFERVKDCTVIEGSLAVALIHPVKNSMNVTTEPRFDNIIFPNLVEITDYLLVYQVDNLRSLRQLFPNLTLIRGQRLFDKFALFVSEMRNLEEIGLDHLAFIENGAVSFQNNPELCYVNSINWNHITDSRPGNLFKNNKKECKICDNTSCPANGPLITDLSSNTTAQNRLCWSENVCQKLCNQECDKQSCYLRKDNKCCPDACLGSCYEVPLEQAKGMLRRANFSDETSSMQTICTICRHVEYKGQCIDVCPKGLYRHLNRRCVTEDECIKASNIYEDPSNGNNKISAYLKPIDNPNGISECAADCPDGFMINPENPHSCIKCIGKCFHQCDGGRVDKVENSYKFKKCTNIKGDLILSLHDKSKNLEKSLEENLGSIETITGFLRVSNSFSLQTLFFFKSLREIHGLTLDRDKYALTVMDNANLKELFWINPNVSSQTKLKIDRGNVSFLLNPNLCVDRISNLTTYTNIKKSDMPNNQELELSNGDKAFCIVEKINITFQLVKHDEIIIQWTQFKPEDYRDLLGYDIWYKETDNRNISSYFENRDVCNQNDWNFIDYDVVNKDNEANYEVHMITNLKAATLYAFFIKAKVLDKRKVITSDSMPYDPPKTGLSDIVYQETKPNKPLPPDDLLLTSPSFSEIEAAWKPPVKPNGKIAYYQVSVEEIKQKETMATDCDDKSNGIYNPTKPVEEQQTSSKEKSPVNSNANGSCCKCNVNIEETRRQEIDTENLIANTVFFVPQHYKIKKMTDEYVHNIRKDELQMVSVNATKFKQQLSELKLKNEQRQIYDKILKETNSSRPYQIEIESLKSFNFTVKQLKELMMNITNLAKIGLTEAQIKQFELAQTELSLYYSYKTFFEQLKQKETVPRDVRGETRFRRFLRSMAINQTLATNDSSIVNENASDSSVDQFDESEESTNIILFNTSETRARIENLKHYTTYRIQVKACLNVSDDDLTIEKQCSNNLVHVINTLPIGGANDLDTQNISATTDNAKSEGNVIIRWPEPERPNGQIKFYKISYRLENRDQKHAILICVPRKDYLNDVKSFALLSLQPGTYMYRIMAVSTAGQGNWTEEFKFKVKHHDQWTYWIVGLIVICLLFLSFAATLTFRIRNKKTDVYTSVNPDYVEYEPDSWEIDRSLVKYELDNKIGQGNYGVVYKGLYIKSENEIMEVAVKTTSEKSNDLQRNRFLQEASTMKLIDCYHVIKLIGVVSKGVPVLVLMEMMNKGDLKTYLKNHRPVENKEKFFKTYEPATFDDGQLSQMKMNKKNSDNNNCDDEKEPKKIELRDLLRWAVQIADGLAYLAAKKFVHRDVSARNCLLSSDLVAKIGDFGMSRDVYSSDIYQKTSKGDLPIRWTSPESLRDGEFTSQSDVWSYGVLLFEMVTLGSQPYQGLSNEQVVRYVTRDNGRLEKPTDCPENLFNIMDLCWASKPNQRPRFVEIIKMLLPHIDEEEFRQNSFYHNHMSESDVKKNTNRSKEKIKKDYLTEMNLLNDDGSDEPLSNLAPLIGGDLKSSDSELQQFSLNNASSSYDSEMRCLSDMTAELVEQSGQLSSKVAFSDNKSNCSSLSRPISQSNQVQDVIVQVGDVITHPTDQLELKKRRKLTSYNNSSSHSSLTNKKSCEESISSQSATSGTSSSNEEHIDLMHHQQTNSSVVMSMNGNLPNGNILLNS